jgi:cytochrome d ubiquinol oxidase subunit I
VDVRIPTLLSFLAYNRFEGKVLGINTLQAEYEARYAADFGAGVNYIPPVTILYWCFRAMVGAGLLMFLVALILVFHNFRKRSVPRFLLGLLPFAIALPYLANITGWILTEMGRQPWIVYGKMLTSQAVSPLLETGMVLASLIGFLLIYGLLMAVDVFLLVKFAKAGPEKPADLSQRSAAEQASWE